MFFLDAWLFPEEGGKVAQNIYIHFYQGFS